MASTEVPAQALPTHCRAHEYASNRVAPAQSGEISPQPPSQRQGQQPHATFGPMLRQKPRGAERPKYRRGRCLPLLLQAVGATHKPEPSALLARYDARYQVTRIQSPDRKLQMPLSERM